MSDNRSSRRGHEAGALDVRNFIAMLLGIYGVVLEVMGLFGTSQADLDRAGGLNVNLWAGAAMMVVAAGFVAWARLRPVVVPEDLEEAEAPADRSRASDPV